MQNDRQRLEDTRGHFFVRLIKQPLPEAQPFDGLLT